MTQYFAHRQSIATADQQHAFGALGRGQRGCTSASW
jgi:hypothetical protein